MAMESPDVAASSPPPDNTSRPRTGGPPRWLVVVLLLAIGVGLWSQRPEPEKPLYVAPLRKTTLISRHVVPYVGVQRHTPDLFGDAALVADPVSGELSVLVFDGGFDIFPGISDYLPLTLDILATKDDGATFGPQIDVLANVPRWHQIGEISRGYLRSSRGTQYVLGGGHFPPESKTPFHAILRSIDDGQSWEVWKHLPADFAELGPNTIQFLQWNDQLILIGEKTLRANNTTEIWSYAIAEDGNEFTQTLITTIPEDNILLNDFLPTPEHLHIGIQTRPRARRGRRSIATLHADGSAITVTELDIPQEVDTGGTTLIKTASGELLAVLSPSWRKMERAWDLDRFLRPPHKDGQLIIPELSDTPASLLWRWDGAASTWSPLNPTKHIGPRITAGKRAAGTMIVENQSLTKTPASRIRFHELGIDAPSWLSYSDIDELSNTRRTVKGSAQMADGDVVLLVEEWATHTTPRQLAVWRIEFSAETTSATESSSPTQ